MTGRLLAAAALALLAVGCGGAGDADAPPPGRFVATSRALTPSVHLFAEPVVARLDVVVDRERLDPDRVRLRASFLPYELVHSVARTRRDFTRFTRLRYEYTLRCLDAACVPTQHATVLGAQESGRPERLTVRFKPARVLYDDPSTGEVRQLRRVWWPPLESTSRINSTDLNAFQTQFRTTVAPLPEPSYRLAPPLLAGLLLAGALALLALPAALAAAWVVRRRPPPAEPEPEAPPLERALRLVERALERGGDAERREALELLAHELDGAGLAGPAGSARELAWSQAPPAPERVSRLVEEVREAGGAAA